MAGTSKHYQMRSGDGTYWDYGIPNNLLAAMVNCAPAHDGSNAAGHMRESVRLQQAIAGVTSWRRKIQILWNMRHHRVKDYIILVEYRVRPGKKPATCPFRAWIGAHRKFKQKKTLKFTALPAQAGVARLHPIPLPDTLRERMMVVQNAAPPPPAPNEVPWLREVEMPPRQDAVADMAQAEVRIAERMQFVMAQNGIRQWRAPARNPLVAGQARAGRPRDGRR